jgi:hypothetical protein
MRAALKTGLFFVFSHCSQIDYYHSQAWLVALLFVKKFINK